MASVAELQILLTAKDSASKQIEGLGKSLGGLGGVGKVATAALAGIATAGVGLVAGIAGSVNAAMNFESAMSAVGAVAGASGDELAQLSAKALALGQDTTLAGIGATDAAAAMAALAAGGVTTTDILEGAARGALLLASAGGIDVARAADIAANALNGFGLAGNQAGHVADLLAAAANASSADVGDLGESLKFVAPVAHSMGLSIEEVVATLTEFGAQGIKGSMAGTALRSIIASLANPSQKSADLIKELGLQFFDTSGHMKSIAGISEELKTKLSGLTDQQRAGALAQIFGNEALSAATILYGEGADGIKKYLEQVNIEGSAAANGAKRNDNLKGSIEQLKSSWETLSITLGTAFIPAIRGVVDWLAQAVNAALPFIQQYGPVLVQALQQGIAVLAQWGQAVGSAVMAVVGAFQAFVQGKTTLAEFIGGMEIFVTAIRDKLAGLAVAAAPYIAQFFQAIGSAIATFAPQIAAQFQLWALSFVNWIQDTAIPFLAPRLQAFGNAVLNWITGTALPAIAATAQQLATALTDWVQTTAIPAVQRQLAAWGAALWGWITGTAVPATVAATQQLATAMTAWVTGTAIPFLQANLPVWGAALWGWITGTAVPNVIAAAKGLGLALGNWILDTAIPFLQANLPVWLAALGNWITGTAVPAVINAAKGLAKGLSDWIVNDALPSVTAKLPIWAAAISSFLAGLPAQLKGWLTPSVTALAEWIQTAIPQAAAKLVLFGAAVVAGLALLPGLITNALARAIPAMWQWITQSVGPALAAFASFAIALVGAALSLGAAIANALYGIIGVVVGAAAAIGQAIVSGIAGAISGGIGAVTSAAVSLATSALDAAKGALGIRSPSKEMAEVGNNVVLGLVQGMDEKQQEAAKKAAEVASAIAKAITDTLGALTALGKLRVSSLPSGGQVSGFLASLADFVEKFTTAAGAFEEDVLKQATVFADAAGKAIGIVKNGVEALAALGKFQAPLGTTVSAFLGSLTDFMEKFSTAASGFETDTLDQASAFAEAAGKVGASIGNALKGLQDLATADWAKSSPTGSAMSWFTHLTASLVANFAQAASLFTDDALAAASAFAETAGKVGTAVGSALKGLQDLAGANWAKSSPTGSAMGWFTLLVASMVKNFEAASKQFDEDGLKAASNFADAAGKVVGIIGPAVSGLTALAAFVSPPKAVVDDFLAMVKYVVGKFEEMAKHLEGEGIKKMGDFADAAGKALAAAKTGTDLFKAFDKLVIPSKEAIDNLLIAVFYIVDQFGRIAAKLEGEGIQKMRDFADAAGQSLSAAKAGADLFKEMEKLAVPSRQAIDNLLEGIKAVVIQMGAIADQIGTAGIQKAQDFATKSLAVFTTFKSSLDLLGSLKDYKQLPLDAINALIDGMKKALEKMGELQGAANAFEQQADTFKGTMERAAKKIADGIALGGNVPSTTPTGGSAPGVGRRAAGGPVAAGLAYLVGERGAELFVPRVAGTIVPSGGAAGGAATVNTYIITGNTLLSKDTATQNMVSGIVTAAQRRTVGYSI